VGFEKTPPLIGLMGQKRSGKDTVAGFLTADHGFVRLAFADALRDALLKVDPYVGRGDLRVSDLIGAVGWEGVKGSPAGPEVRRLLQEFGVAVRAVREDAWVAVVMRDAATIREGGPGTPSPVGRSVVVTDVRFPDEAAAIRAAGGVIVEVRRPGLPDDDGHVSEHAWRGIEPRFVIENSGTLDDLRERATTLVALAR
jgi:hypothetical protein